MNKLYLQVVAVLAAVLAVSAKHVNKPLNSSCTVTSYDDVTTATSSCTTLVISGITVPAGKQLLLDLKTGASVTLEGTITFAHSAWAGPLVVVKGSKVTVTGASGAVLDGLGAKYWDGKGDSGTTKPKFFRIQTTGGSVFKNIKLLNCPKQCVSISSASDTTLNGWTIDVSDGDDNGGKNTDGFDLSGSSGITVENSVVKNQDDCVAINQGSGYIFKNLTCSGGHGLSLSVGLSSSDGSANTVKNVTFSSCTVKNSRNGIHIKTHTDGGTGTISDVTYSGITLSGITYYGVNVEQDYKDGTTTGDPSDNIPITDLTLKNVEGTMSGGSHSMAVYILCASDGCSDWTWSGVSITNAAKSSSCSYSPTGYSC